MKLIGSLTSPYVRKVRVVMAEKKLDYQFELEDVWGSDNILKVNPLGKVPCLVMEGQDSITGDWHNDTQVKLQLYKEMSIGNVENPAAPSGGGNWVLVNEYTDNGNLSSGTPCTHRTSPDDDPYGAANKPFTWPNYSVYLRTDGIGNTIPQYYKWFSVREVAPIGS